MKRAGHPSRVEVFIGSVEGQSSGLRLDSVIVTDNIVTVLESAIDSILGKMPDMKKVDDALKHSFGLE
jgi:mRNA-degrading endonuclease toxin of MazEF toxin-antitoxin module